MATNNCSKLNKCLILKSAICSAILLGSLLFAISGTQASAVVGIKVLKPEGMQMSNTVTAPPGTNQLMSNATTNNIVLVHGKWVDGSSWSKVIPILEKAGHKVIAVQLALHSLADDVATVKRAIDLVGGPTILVAHSYGGFVITNAAYNNENVTGLVYVAAHAPKEGQSSSDLVSASFYPKGFLIHDSAGFVYINSTQFHDVFAQDVDPAQTNIMAAAQKPFNQSINTEKSGPPAWKQLPTWYQISENVRIIPPDLERQYAKQMNATTISLPASHASMLSHPNEIAQLILNATKAAAKGFK